MDANIDINVPLVAIDLNFPFFNYEANSPNSLDLNEPPLNEDDVPLFLSSDPTEEEYTQSDEEFEDFLNNQWDVEQENSIDGDAIDNHEEANEDLPLPQVVTINKRGKNMSNDTRRDIYEMLLKKSVDGKLGRNATREVSSHISVPILSVQRIWKRAKDCGAHVDVSHKMSRGGRKRVEIDLEKIRDVPLHKRTTIESLAYALDVKKTTLFWLIKFGKIRKHSNAIKPFLKEENKRARLQFCIKMIDANSIPNNPTFVGMYNIIHIDEKWFSMTKKK
uniref:Mariner transposase, putative n=1 Tax=Medicago truncatula TaxID=3880 RepID=A2Q5G5_MEDTR|nr:mariner transposase, putative [Medicago truncatula]